MQRKTRNENQILVQKENYLPYILSLSFLSRLFFLGFFFLFYFISESGVRHLNEAEVVWFSGDDTNGVGVSLATAPALNTDH